MNNLTALLGLSVVAVVVLYIALLVFLMVYSLFAYLAQGFSFLKISKKLGLRHGWMGFVPYACYYQMGKFVEEDDKRNHPEKKGLKWSIFLPVSLGVYIVLSFLSVILYYAGNILISVFASGTEEAATFLLIGYAVYILTVLLIMLTFMVILYVAQYKVFHVLAGKHAVWMTILTLFVSVSTPVLYLVLAFSKKFQPKEIAAASEFSEE